MNKKRKDIVLYCTPLITRSRFDEDAFFEWLKKINCVKYYIGIGRYLLIYIKSKRASKNDVRELKSIFRRYGYDLEQLNIFKNYIPYDYEAEKERDLHFNHAKKMPTPDEAEDLKLRAKKLREQYEERCTPEQLKYMFKS